MLIICVITDYCWHTHLAQAPPPGPPLRKIYLIMLSEPADADKAAEILVDEGVHKTDPKYSYADVVEALVTEYSESAVLGLAGDSGRSK